MNMDYLNKNRHLAGPVLLGVSVVLAALTAAKLWDYHSASANAQSIIAKAVDQDKADPNVLEENLAGCKEIAEALKKNNLFMPPPKKPGHPVSAVQGIMGNEVLINNKWYKVGDKISDAEVVSIEATLVKIKWNGKEKTFAPISAIVAAAPKPAVKAADEPKVKKKPKKPDAKPKKDKAVVEIASGEKDPLAWMGVDLPPRLRAMMMEQWNNASEEEKQQGMEQWNKLSDEEKSAAISSM
jgi:hypothetical protein